MAVLAPSVPNASRRYFWQEYPPLVVVAIAWILGIFVIAALADLLAPYTYTALDLKARLQPPIGLGGTTQHLLGTDELGRDVLSRLLISVQVSLLIAFASTLLSAVIGLTLGFLAAHFKGWLEQVVLTLIDFQA
jgi:peptide/nickel transport system permease protein